MSKNNGPLHSRVLEFDAGELNRTASAEDLYWAMRELEWKHVDRIQVDRLRLVTE